jgi:arylsulfatase A-like enzyme
MFTSDQGYLLGHRGLQSKGGAAPIQYWMYPDNRMLWVINMYDLAYRIPLIVKWPGVARPGGVIPELVSNIDTYATVLGMLGITPPRNAPVEGRDLTPLLRNERVPSWRDVIFAQHTPDQVGNIEFVRMIRGARWKLVRAYLNPTNNQLFDLQNDPQELRNLYYADLLTPRDTAVPRYRAIRDSLDRRLLEWQRSIDDPAIDLDRAFSEAKRRARARWERPQ